MYLLVASRMDALFKSENVALYAGHTASLLLVRVKVTNNNMKWPKREPILIPGDVCISW
jgi:hypothetical protein